MADEERAEGPAAHAHQDARRNTHLELVVSGPTSNVIHARRTEQVLLQLIDEAAQEILLITYALHMHEQLRTALTAATARGVTVAVLAEDPLDDPNFFLAHRPRHYLASWSTGYAGQSINALYPGLLYTLRLSWSTGAPP